MEQQQGKFEGWAVVELFGHQREVGFVTTQQFGQACLFQIDVPELPAREFELRRPEVIGEQWVPAGAKVRREIAPARTRLVGPGAVYALNPCTEEAARVAIEELAPRRLILLDMPKKEVAAFNAAPPYESCETCGHQVCICDEDQGHDDF